MNEFSYGFILGVSISVIPLVFLFFLLTRNHLSTLKAFFKEFQIDSLEQSRKILNPLEDKLTLFQIKNAEYTSLLKGELEHVLKFGQTISDETNRLTNALKGNIKVQGNWGEMILERVLEVSGLVEGREFFRQKVYKVQSERLIPDIVVELPGKRLLIIDSKMTFNSYERYLNSSDEQDLKAIRDSIKKHVEDLSAKNYSAIDELNTPDFVILFIPLESVLPLALGLDAGLLEWAYRKKVILASPSTLLLQLKTATSLWRIQNQTQNAKEIAKQAGGLYDKFQLLANDILKIRNSVSKVSQDVEVVHKRIADGKDNLIQKAEKLKELGAETKH